MNPLQPDDVLSIPAPAFQPLRLSLDDALPVSMVLLLGYRRRLDPAALRQALQTALLAFPHLGGRLHLELQPLRAALVPGGAMGHIRRSLLPPPDPPGPLQRASDRLERILRSGLEPGRAMPCR